MSIAKGLTRPPESARLNLTFANPDVFFNSDTTQNGATPMSNKTRKERWVFCESELTHPETCKSYDELTTTVLDPDSDPDNPEHLEQGVIVYRNGEVSNRWNDGTAGIPADVAELANCEETYYHPERDEYADIWADVFVDNNGAWLGWAGAAPKAKD